MALDATLCCLCLKTSEMLLDIFEEQSNHKNLAAIISQHFWFDIKREDTNSKCVCVECWSNVDNFHTFYTHVYTVHNEFYSSTYEEIKIEIDDFEEHHIDRNKSERQKKLEDSIQQVGKFEILIVNENHELFDDLKEEEFNADSLLTSPRVGSLRNKKLKTAAHSDDQCNTAETSLGTIGESNIDNSADQTETTLKAKGARKKKLIKSRDKDSTVERKDVESTNDNIDAKNTRFENKDESNGIELMKQLKNESGPEIGIPEIKISESSNDSFGSNDSFESNDSFGSNDDSSDSVSDASINKPKIKRARKKKSKEIEPDAEAKLEEENAQIRERFVMKCELCSFHFDDFTHVLMHYRETHNKRGFLRCCDTKFSSRPTVIEHVQYHLSPDDFKCDHCDKIFVRKSSLKEHLLRHLPVEVKPFKCPKCPKSYIKYFLLRRHLGTHDLEDKKIEEPFEDLDANDKNGLEEKKVQAKESKTKKKVRKYRYLREVDPAEEAKIAEENVKIAERFAMQCEICYEPFDALTDAQSHYRNKHAKPGYLRCCNVKFYTRPTVLEHLRRHIAPTEFKCVECDKYFVNKRNLTYHMVNHKPLERPFKCQHCPKDFTTKFFLGKHLEQHKGVPQGEWSNFKCDQCDKEFRRKQHLIVHKKDRHERCTLHICDVCAKEFPNKNDFDKHHRNMHEKHARVQCNVCGAWLKTQQYLMRHMLLHQDIDKMLPCTECDKRFPFQKALRNHILNVHPKEMFSCNMCDKQFKSRNSLKEHLANHTGFSLYKCPHCPKTFSIRATMYSHRKKMHKAEWEEHLRLKAAGLN